MSPLGANGLLLPLENWARDAAVACEKAFASGPAPAIALGGGFQRDASDLEDIAALSHSSYERSVHAAQLYRSGLVSRLYVTGGSHGKPVSEALVMTHLLQGLALTVTTSRLKTEPTTLAPMPLSWPPCCRRRIVNAPCGWLRPPCTCTAQFCLFKLWA